MRLLFLSLAVCTTLVSFLAGAETRTVEYSTDLCTCKATFDTRSLSPAEVAGTWAFEKLPVLGTVVTRSNLGRLQGPEARAMVKEVNDEYARNLETFRKLALPKGRDWESLKERYLGHLRLSRYLDLAELAFVLEGKPSRLLEEFDGRRVPEECRSFASALGDPSATEKAFSELSKKNCATNARPAACLVSARETGARTYLLVFGWHNCVNGKWRRKFDYGKDLHQALADQQKKFTKNDCRCEEP